MILFSLENCEKCNMTKEFLNEHKIKFEEIKLSKDPSNWTKEQEIKVFEYSVKKDLSRTAPLAYTRNDMYLIGYLQIRQYVKQAIKEGIEI